MAEALDREQVAAFLKALTRLCTDYGIQAQHGRDSILLRKLDREHYAGYGAGFGFSAGWRLELVSQDTVNKEGVMPKEFFPFDGT
jgi:hypothetical protein